MSSPNCYNIVVFGEPSVGKTCFIDQFCYGRSFVIYDPDNSVFSHKIVMDGQISNLTLVDLSTSFLKPENETQHTEWAEKMLAESDGIVLLYSITSFESFEYVINQAYKYVWGSRRLKRMRNEEVGGDERESFGCVLVGNKLDLVVAGKESRAVGRSLAEEWAQTQGVRSIEVDSLGREGPESALKLLVKNIEKVARLERRGDEKHEGMGGQKDSIRNTLKGVFKVSNVWSGTPDPEGTQS